MDVKSQTSFLMFILREIKGLLKDKSIRNYIHHTHLSTKLPKHNLIYFLHTHTKFCPNTSLFAVALKIFSTVIRSKIYLFKYLSDSQKLHQRLKESRE